MKSTVRRFATTAVSEHALGNGPLLLPVGAEHQKLSLSFVRRGSLEYLESDGHDGWENRRIVRGQAFLSVGERRIKMTSREHCVIITVTSPLIVREGHPDWHTFYVMRGADPLAKPIFAFMQQLLLLDDTALDDTAIRHVESLLLTMVGLVVPQPFGAADSPLTDPFTQARTVISSRCTNAALRAHDIAREMSLSLRQLERVFASHDTTIVAEIRRARVRKAVAVLKNDVARQLTMDQIGRTVGLSGGASLARAFRAEKIDAPALWREQ